MFVVFKIILDVWERATGHKRSEDLIRFKQTYELMWVNQMDLPWNINGEMKT